MSRKHAAISICTAFLALAVGCEGTATLDGAVLVTVRYADEITPSRRAATTRVEMIVEGDATPFSFSVMGGDVRALDTRPTTFRYIPRAKSGTLTFRAVARDAGGATVAQGSGAGVIDPGVETQAEVALRAPEVVVDAGPDIITLPDIVTVPDIVVLPDIVTLPDFVDVPDLTEVPDVAIIPDLAVVPDVAMVPDVAVPPDVAMAPPDMTMQPPDMAMATDMAVATDMAMAPADMAMPPADTAVAPDVALPPDMAQRPPDLAVAPDLTSPPDLLQPPLDMTQSFTPSHVAPTAYRANAANLPSTIATINTTVPELRDAQNMLVVINGVTFAVDGSNSAVLSIGSWNVTSNVTVTGINKLVVVAAGAVTVSAQINGSANFESPGPGGGGPGVGTGKGGETTSMTAEDPGGGGGGFGQTGAKAGDTMRLFGPNGGTSYGDLIANWNAGSGGGRASFYADCAGSKTPLGGLGGGGGGAVQISSAAGITVGMGGAILVNGGGGRGGCYYKMMNFDLAVGGGGGGSGGEIFLEAPTVNVAGGLFANGGGGGGGGDAMFGKIAGADGQNGLTSATAAGGGATAGSGGVGGRGGFGGVAGMPPTTSMTPFANVIDSGGGGGGTGRIWLRTRNVAPTVTGTISGTDRYDQTLP